MPTLPRIIKFAFNKYDVKDGKHKAECNMCKSVIREKTGTTSGFVRHLKNQHKHMFDQYVRSDPKMIASSEREDNLMKLFGIDHDSFINSQDVEMESINKIELPNEQVQNVSKRISNSMVKNAQNGGEKIVSLGSYFKQKAQLTTQVAMDDEDDLFGKLLTAEIKKIAEPSLKRRLKRQILETVYTIQDEYEASNQNHNASVLRVLSDNSSYQNLVIESKVEEFTS